MFRSREDRSFYLPRLWSNRELEKIAPLFTGDIANISGASDDDKEGGKYSNYFINKKSYTVTNYKGYRGEEQKKCKNFLNLAKKIPSKFVSRFDVVFNHTTLEHIYEIDLAFENLCKMTRDIVIIVIPFLQELHFTKDSYLDYWRFTPYTLEKLFSQSGLKLIYISANDKSNRGIYLFSVGTRDPKKWTKAFPRVNRQIFQKLGSF